MAAAGGEVAGQNEKGGRGRPSLAAKRPSTLLCFHGPIIVRLQSVGREHEALGRHHLGGIGPLRFMDFLEERVLGGLRRGELVPGLEKRQIDLGRRRQQLDAVLRTNSSIASAFCRCQVAHQRKKVSDVADLMASLFWAGRLSQTSLLIASSATDALSCMPGV